MNQPNNIQPYKAPLHRRAKLTVPVNIEGAVGEFLELKFVDLRERDDKKEKRIDELTKLIYQIAENVKFPVRVYTEDDFTELFGLKKRTQQQYRKEGKLHCVKMGESVRYSQQDIEDFIQRFDTLNYKNTYQNKQFIM